MGRWHHGRGVMPPTRILTVAVRPLPALAVSRPRLTRSRHVLTPAPPRVLSFAQADAPARPPEPKPSTSAPTSSTPPTKAPAAVAGDAASGAAEGEAGGAVPAPRAEEVLQQAHLALKAEIDLDRGLTKDDAARDAAVPLQRSFNPLKPARSGLQPGSKGISIAEYQRRKGLVSDA